MSVNQKFLESFVDLVTKTNLSYNEEAKNRFKRDGMKIMREIAERLELKKGDYDLRWNAGGIAVSGDITLHTDFLYVQFTQMGTGDSLGFMYRLCHGRRDYCGESNCWIHWSELIELDMAVWKLKDAMNYATHDIA